MTRLATDQRTPQCRRAYAQRYLAAESGCSPHPGRTLQFLLGTLTKEQSDYIRFRVEELKCRFTTALLSDLRFEWRKPGAWKPVNAEAATTSQGRGTYRSERAGGKPQNFTALAVNIFQCQQSESTALLQGQTAPRLLSGHFIASQVRQQLSQVPSWNCKR
jgi:hypothetical protein